jgi:hypothetical protein
VLRKVYGARRVEVREDCIMRSFMICTPHLIVDEACGKYGRKEKCIHDFDGET